MDDINWRAVVWYAGPICVGLVLGLVCALWEDLAPDALPTTRHLVTVAAGLVAVLVAPLMMIAAAEVDPVSQWIKGGRPE